MYTLLIVDDEPNILIGMKALIDWESYGITRIETATNCADGLARAVDTRPQIALIDVCVGKDFGQDLVKRIKESGVDCACIMMSGHREFGYACEALRCGAWDYLLKPIQADKLIAAVELIIREKLHGTIHHVSKEEEEDPVLGKKLSELPTLINKLLAMVRAEYRQIGLRAKPIHDLPKIADGTAISGDIDISRIRKTVGIPSLRIALRIVMENADPSLAKIVIPRP